MGDRPTAALAGMRGQRPAPDGSTSTTVWPVGRDRYTGVENPGPVRTGSRTRLRGGRRLATILGRAVTGGLAPDPCDGLLPACTRRSVLPGTLRPRRRDAVSRHRAARRITPWWVSQRLHGRSVPD